MVVYTLELRFAKWAFDRLTEDTDFGKKKIIFSDEAHFDLGTLIFLLYQLASQCIFFEHNILEVKSTREFRYVNRPLSNKKNTK